MPTITFLGHACFSITEGEHTVLIDPWLTGNPQGAASADEVEATTILLTHGHVDHYGDTVDIAKRTGAKVQAIVEIAKELADKGCEVVDVNFGGTGEYEWGWARLVPAFHTSTTPDGVVTPAGGLVVSIGGTVVYHLGDTALFSDLALPARRDAIDVAIVPIGGHYTMDRHDAVTAVELVGATTVIPCHYDTFPPIETDAEAFRSDVEASTAANVVILAPGESHEA